LRQAVLKYSIILGVLAGRNYSTKAVVEWRSYKRLVSSKIQKSRCSYAGNPESKKRTFDLKAVIYRAVQSGSKKRKQRKPQFAAAFLPGNNLCG